MSRILPYPGLSVALAIFWILLHNSLSPATLAGALMVGLIAPFVLLPLQVARPRIKSFSAMLRLAAIVALDIIRSNFTVAAIILSGERRKRRSGFVLIPLDLTNQYGLALLAIIITSSPGTLWAQHDAAERRLLLHVFDLVDENEWIKLVKERYEPLLMEIWQ